MSLLNELTAELDARTDETTVVFDVTAKLDKESPASTVVLTGAVLETTDSAMFEAGTDTTEPVVCVAVELEVDEAGAVDVVTGIVDVATGAADTATAAVELAATGALLDA
jgi:hypothetical protein